MKVCIIHGSPRRGNTYIATEIVKRKMKEFGDVEFSEYFLSKDMPYFCCGCYRCFDLDEHSCPHANSVQPIVKSIEDSDGIILTSPVYVLAESGQMKAFLDHLGYLYIPHRPMEVMFSKVAMVISTTAGAGTSKSISAISRSLSYWGVKRIYKVGLVIFSKNWADMKKKKQNKFEKLLSTKAKKLYLSLDKKEQLSFRFFTRAMFSLMRRMISSYPDDSTDKIYWRKMGWLNKQSPFKSK